MLNSPSNPTGAAYTRDELKKLTDVLVRHPHVFVMTDDMYEHLVYDDFEFFTPAQVEPRLYERTLTINGVLQGLLHDRLAHRLRRRARAADQGDGDDPVAVDLEPDRGGAMGRGRGARRAAGLHRRSTTRSSRSAAISASRCSTRRNGIKCPKPEGAFYVYPSCAGTIGKTAPSGKKLATDEDFVTELLEAEGVAVVQGTPFGFGPAFRISYATKTERCRRGVPAHPALLRQSAIVRTAGSAARPGRPLVLRQISGAPTGPGSEVRIILRPARPLPV